MSRDIHAGAGLPGWSSVRLCLMDSIARLLAALHCHYQLQKDQLMKIGLSFCSLVVLVTGLSVMDTANAAVQTINASSSGGSSTSGNAVATSTAVVTCTAATGGQNGTVCHVTAPGWNGIVPVGKSIGTSGAGNVKLTCNGSYAASGGRLACTAQINDALCSPEQSITASASTGNSNWGYAPIKGAAIVQCLHATGSVNITPRCNINAPGYSGGLTTGQTIATTGAGTVTLNCTGMYPANGGGLNCSAQVSQVCP